jgi:hypothetical protein
LHSPQAIRNPDTGNSFHISHKSSVTFIYAKITVLVMSREEGTALSNIARIFWMLLSHKYVSLRYGRTSHLIREALSHYQNSLILLEELPHCMSCQEMAEEGLFKEKYWKFGIFMAAATSLPLLHGKVTRKELIRAICAKASVSTSAKLLDNLNDKIHSYGEAVQSLSQYRSALGKGTYAVTGTSPILKAEQSAHEIATWVYPVISQHSDSEAFSDDVDRLVEGQIASLQHKKGKYPSMKEYLSNICERSIGNVWIDVDLVSYVNENSDLKEGNDYIFKSYLIYDDVQDIFDDIKTNSVNSAIISGIERGLLSESDTKEKNKDKIIQKLEECGIFRDLLRLGDLVFLKGLETIAHCDRDFDRGGLAASLGMIRMFNIRRILKREKNLGILNTFFASRRRLENMRNTAPEYIQKMIEYVA